MVEKTEYYSSSDGRTDIYVAVWEPGGEPVALLQVVHGMAEFIDRYDRFARVLAEHGILVAGNDHLGHGYSVKSKDDWGYFADYHGNRCVLEDMRSLYGILKAATRNALFYDGAFDGVFPCETVSPRLSGRQA